jgi:hypothetical protein
MMKADALMARAARLARAGAQLRQAASEFARARAGSSPPSDSFAISTDHNLSIAASNYHLALIAMVRPVSR